MDLTPLLTKGEDETPETDAEAGLGWEKGDYSFESMQVDFNRVREYYDLMAEVKGASSKRPPLFDLGRGYVIVPETDGKMKTDEWFEGYGPIPVKTRDDLFVSIAVLTALLYGCVLLGMETFPEAMQGEDPASRRMIFRGTVAVVMPIVVCVIGVMFVFAQNRTRQAVVYSVVCIWAGVVVTVMSTSLVCSSVEFVRYMDSTDATDYIRMTRIDGCISVSLFAHVWVGYRLIKVVFDRVRPSLNEKKKGKE